MAATLVAFCLLGDIQLVLIKTAINCLPEGEARRKIANETSTKNVAVFL